MKKAELKIDVPLTTEILENAGFKSGNDDGYTCDFSKDSFFIVCGVDDENGGDYFIEDKTGTRLFFVQELQKLYYALTGQELIINTDK